MYKNKDKQREAVKQATRRYRAKGITRVSPVQGITVVNEQDDVIPEQSTNPMMVGYVPPRGEA